MPSDLDRRMDAGMAALTGRNGSMRLGQAGRNGRVLPVIAAAPPTLPAYFADCAARHPDATFLVAGAERLSFAEVLAAANRVAAALVGGARRIRPGDRVGIAMRNSPAWIALYMGIVSAGGIATLLNGWWQADELEAATKDVGCTLIFADAPRAERLRAIAGLGATIVEIDDAQPLATALADVVGDACVDAALPAIGPDDPATILFTSGSTGRSRGALSCHRAVTQAAFSFLAQSLTMRAIAAEEGEPPRGQPATLLNLPLFHVTAEVSVMLQSFALGRKLVLMPRWDAEEAMRLMEAERVTYFVGVPLMSHELLIHPRRGCYDLSSVTDFSAGGAPRPAGHVRRMATDMTGAPLIGYGLTETNGVGTGNWRSNYLAKPDSAGRPGRPLEPDHRRATSG